MSADKPKPNLNEIDEKTQFCVNGFLKSQGKEIFKENRKEFFGGTRFNLHIRFCCMQYSMQKDIFKLYSKSFKSSNAGKSITKTKDDNNLKNSIYGDAVINSNLKCKCSWKVMIKTHEFKYNAHGYLYAGLSSAPFNTSKRYDESRKNKHYSLLNWNGNIKTHDEECYGDDLYLMSWHEPKMTFNIELDLVKKKIRFWEDESDERIVIEEIECGSNIEYRLSLIVPRMNCDISILDFEQVFYS